MLCYILLMICSQLVYPISQNFVGTLCSEMWRIEGHNNNPTTTSFQGRLQGFHKKALYEETVGVQYHCCKLCWLWLILTCLLHSCCRWQCNRPQHCRLTTDSAIDLSIVGSLQTCHQEIFDMNSVMIIIKYNFLPILKHGNPDILLTPFSNFEDLKIHQISTTLNHNC